MACCFGVKYRFFLSKGTLKLSLFFHYKILHILNFTQIPYFIDVIEQQPIA